MRRTKAFLIGGGGFLAGLAVGTIWLPPLVFVWFGAIATIALLLAGWKRLFWKRLTVFLLFLVLGLVYVHSWQARELVVIPYGRSVIVEVEVISCKPSFRSARCVLDGEKPPHSRIASVLPQEFAPGERITVTGTIVSLPEKYQFMRGDGVVAWLDSSKIGEVHLAGKSWRKTLDDFKVASEQKLVTVLPEPAASLATGLLFGSRQQFTDDFYDALKRTNTLHIVAVSGFNITLLAEFVRRALARLPRKFTFVLSSFLIVAFVAMIGAPASAVRAAIMGIALLFGKLIGRRPYVPSLLILTALLMALPNPYILRYDVGFQLSFLAFLGLVALSPFLERHLNFLPKPVRGIGAATLGATLATLPILIPLSGTVSLVGPVANMLILPLIPLIMLLSGLLLPISFLATEVARVLGFFLYLPCLLVTQIIERAAILPIATTPWVLGVSIMLFISFLGVIFRRRHAHP